MELAFLIVGKKAKDNFTYSKKLSYIPRHLSAKLFVTLWKSMHTFVHIPLKYRMEQNLIKLSDITMQNKQNASYRETLLTANKPSLHHSLELQKQNEHKMA